MVRVQPTVIGGNAAYIAHEVNQPLAAILTNAEVALRWLEREPANLDEAREALECIIGNSRRAAGVVRSFRTLMRQLSPTAPDLDLNEVIRDLLGLLKLEFERHGIAVRTRLAANLRPIQGDRGKLEQVIANLVANGVDAMCAVEGRQRLLQIATRQDERGDVLVEVEDSGIGIDPAKFDRIFDALFTTKREGTGLGLSICRSIVESHGGRLWAEPNRPHGSVFRFVIPARRP